MRTRLPVRSALFKHDTGGLVVKWVTISESLLLYVFAIFWCHSVGIGAVLNFSCSSMPVHRRSEKLLGASLISPSLALFSLQHHCSDQINRSNS
jgi:hypothetical protein